MKALAIVAPSAAETTGTNSSAPSGIANNDPLMALRLWSVIDVYGRIRRAAAAEDNRASSRAYRAGDAVA